LNKKLIHLISKQLKNTSTKTLLKNSLAFFSFFALFSCKKEFTDNSKISVVRSESNQSAITEGDCERRWIGLYANGLQPNDSINQNEFIKGGIAQLPAVNWYNYHTGIYYNLPLCHTLAGDSIRFEASVKNPDNGAGSVFSYEIALQIYGTKSYAEVYFVGSTVHQSYDHIWVGNYQIAGLPELVHYFGEYETLAVEFKNNTLSIYRGGEFVKSIIYNVSDRIGKIKRIGYGFKGTGAIDWVKLYSSKSNNLLMSEDFNVDGQSSVVWY